MTEQFQAVISSAVDSPRGVRLRSRTTAPVLKLFQSVFLALGLLPYVVVIPTSSDTQPNAFFMGAFVLALCYRPRKLDRPIAWLWILVPLGLGVFMAETLAGTNTFNNIRSLYNYLALPVIATAVAVQRDTIRRLLPPILNFVNVTYLVVGVAQILTGQQLVGGFVGRGNIEGYAVGYRGTLSLAPEPTAYATIMFLFLIIYLILGMERSWGAILCLVQILFVAKSTAVLLFLLVTLVCRVLSARRFKTLILAGLSISILVFAVLRLEYFSGSRMQSVGLRLINDPAGIVDTDISITSRLTQAWYASTGVFHNYGAPNGFSTFVPYYDEAMSESSWLTRRTIAGISVGRDNRIMSGFGSLLFELGVLGFIVPISLARLVVRHFGSLFSQSAVTCFVGLNLVAFGSGVILGFPPFALIVGLLGGNSVSKETAAVRPR